MASLADLPSCALTCLSTAIANSTCAPTDLACTCTNAAITGQATVCMLGSCTMAEILSATNVTNTLCGVKSALDESWIVPTIVLLCLMVIVVGLRFLARVIVDMPFWWDDWMNFVSMAFCIALSIAAFQGLKANGYGKDIWAVPTEDISEFLKSYYVATAMYVGARCFTRVSIILFYLRIFTVTETRRKIIWTLVGEIIISLAFVLTIMFQCTPISYYWTKWDLQHTGHCIDTYRFMLIGWSILIATDFWVMWLPLPMVARLQLSLRKKLLISVMFATGLAVTAIGIAKLPMVYRATHTTNPTYDLVNMGKFCIIEVDLGVICSCMPSLPVLFRPLVHRLTGKNKSSTAKGTGYIGATSRRAVMGDIKSSATTSAASYPVSSPNAHHSAYYEHIDPRTEQIQATTTIDQTYWRNDSDELPLHGTDIELGTANNGYVSSQAWAAGPGAGSYGVAKQAHQ
ncbi:uncharacterized protein J7T55_000404 [Diaporthe amygdali]|uniref:uncharacterized protein n=1 Tax=Phomopsis amygdali TaxID=1214568 RepID=UPI0022FF2632|nr:uncharacterized protein J7T55_000404 [Diaporthe amygdali]KAJ0109478.1 uncharacterized protein J7T55_000404 [Diaporthe amygdali]